MFPAIFLIVAVVRCTFAAPNVQVVQLAYEKIDEAPVISPFIVGGKPGNITYHPYVVSLLVNFGPLTGLCGGTIINSQWIVTAAHCFYDKLVFAARSVSVRAGSNYYHSGGTLHSGLCVVLIGYDPSSHLNDIALVKVTPPFILGRPNFDLIPLPQLGTRPPVDTTVKIFGWGTTSYGGPLPEQLQHAKVTVFNQTECQGAYGEIIQNSMFCAGKEEGGIDSCQGDSGGPAVYCPTKNSPVIVGIVSFGYGCAWKGYPGVYTNVGSYIDVIEYIIQNYCL